MKIRSIPPTYFITGFFLIITIYIVLPAFNFIPFPLNLAGTVIMIAGFILVSKSYNLFQHYQTPHNFDTSSTLITDGVFNYTRNPMYLGMVLILIGLAITCKNIIAVGIALIFFLILHFMFIPFEEIKLEKTFGENYLAYKQRVRRWL